MKLNKMTKEEIESYSYIDLTKIIIEQSKKKLNTSEIFKKICNLLEMSDEEYENKISNFYTDLTTDKTFIMLDDGSWDLRSHYSSSVNLDDTEEEEDLTETEEEIEDEMDDMAPDEYHDMDDDSEMDDTTLDDVDELDEEELTIIEEDELD